MNCRKFDEIVPDLVVQRPFEATLKHEALRHVEQCSRCAAQLHNQQQLSYGLRHYAADTATATASAQLKNSLLTAFAQQNATPVVAAPRMLRPRQRQVWPLAGFAVAATVLVLFSVMLASRWRETAIPATSQIAKTSPAPGITPVIAAPTVLPTATSTGIKSSSAPIEAKSVAVSVQPRRLKSSIRTDWSQTTALSQPNNNNEFIPLTYAPDAQSLQNGLLVRVEVPRATLLAMGLPLPAERVSETVKADVMLGENGVAYAIRLVSTTGQ